MMELYTLDSLYRRQNVIDQFQSLVWAERWQSYGDFELDMFSSYGTRSLLKPDTWVAVNVSNYVCRIETVEDDIDDQGNKILKVKGRTIEALFDDRAAPRSTWSEAPAAVARDMFHQVCVAGTWDIGDIIPGITEGTFMPASTILEPTDAISVDTTQVPVPTLFTAMVTNICAKYYLGFRILRKDSTGQLYFDIYAGSDRTTDQTVLTPVVFAPQFDNLENTSELTDITTAKNVAYVQKSDGTSQIVYGSGVDPTVDSFERRVMIVDASNLTSPTTAELTQLGLEALAASATKFIFDGEISQYSQYVYGTDYNLGDLVELQNDDGVQSDMRVTEQIFAQDQNGFRSYPTLASYETINAGSWLSWNNDKTWNDLDSDTTNVWENQP